jgi:hypothetical protein
VRGGGGCACARTCACARVHIEKKRRHIVILLLHAQEPESHVCGGQLGVLYPGGDVENHTRSTLCADEGTCARVYGGDGGRWCWWLGELFFTEKLLMLEHMCI